jgi:hypothetical protein
MCFKGLLDHSILGKKQPDKGTHRVPLSVRCTLLLEPRVKVTFNAVRGNPYCAIGVSCSTLSIRLFCVPGVTKEDSSLS